MRRASPAAALLVLLVAGRAQAGDTVVARADRPVPYEVVERTWWDTSVSDRHVLPSRHCDWFLRVHRPGRLVAELHLGTCERGQARPTFTLDDRGERFAWRDASGGWTIAYLVEAMSFRDHRPPSPTLDWSRVPRFSFDTAVQVACGGMGFAGPMSAATGDDASRARFVAATEDCMHFGDAWVTAFKALPPSLQRPMLDRYRAALFDPNSKMRDLVGATRFVDLSDPALADAVAARASELLDADVTHPVYDARAVARALVTALVAGRSPRAGALACDGYKKFEAKQAMGDMGFFLLGAVKATGAPCPEAARDVRWATATPLGP